MYVYVNVYVNVYVYLYVHVYLYVYLYLYVYVYVHVCTLCMQTYVNRLCSTIVLLLCSDLEMHKWSCLCATMQNGDEAARLLWTYSTWMRIFPGGCAPFVHLSELGGERARMVVDVRAMLPGTPSSLCVLCCCNVDLEWCDFLIDVAAGYRGCIHVRLKRRCQGPAVDKDGLVQSALNLVVSVSECNAWEILSMFRLWLVMMNPFMWQGM